MRITNYLYLLEVIKMVKGAFYINRSIIHGSHIMFMKNLTDFKIMFAATNGEDIFIPEDVKCNKAIVEFIDKYKLGVQCKIFKPNEVKAVDHIIHPIYRNLHMIYNDEPEFESCLNYKQIDDDIIRFKFEIQSDYVEYILSHNVQYIDGIVIFAVKDDTLTSIMYTKFDKESIVPHKTISLHATL